MTSTGLEKFAGFLNPITGELLDPTVDNAARVIEAVRTAKANLHELLREATAYLVAESQHRGTKTLHGENATIELKGGTSTEYDPGDLMEALAAADCPAERIDQAVVAHVTYKVDRSVLRELRTNPDYRAAIELAERQIEKPYQASVKLRRETTNGK